MFENVLLCVVETWIEVEDAHAVFLVLPDTERYSMEVHGVELPTGAHIHQVPPRGLVLRHHQAGKSL